MGGWGDTILPDQTSETFTMRRLSFLWFIVLLVITPHGVTGQEEPIVIYLVRHSERAEDGTNDPPISDAGWARSRLLSEILQDAGLTHIHSTDYKRTLLTGEPTAEATGLTIDLYDARDLAAEADRIAATPGRHLVLGHSNTTPVFVEALGGEAGTPIAEMEYDRLYIVTLFQDSVSSVLLRFGEKFSG